jgi:glutathione S-transferase
LVGDQFTLADINQMPILAYIKQFPEGAEAMAGTKHLAAYYERNAVRPGFQDTGVPTPPAKVG